MKPHDLNLIRYTLACIWLVTAGLSLGIYPIADSLKLLAQVGLHGQLAELALYGSALLDLSLGLLTLCYARAILWRMQIALIVSYSIIIALYLPEYWLHPFGPVLKNLPILLLLWLLLEYQEHTS